MQKNLTTYMIMYYDHTHSSHQHPHPPPPPPPRSPHRSGASNPPLGKFGQHFSLFLRAQHSHCRYSQPPDITGRPMHATSTCQRTRVAPSPTSAAAAAAAAAARQHTRQEQAPVESNHPTGFTQSLPRPFTPCSYRRRRGAANQRQGVTCDSSSSGSSN
jgi:hypothetical protein